MIAVASLDVTSCEVDLVGASFSVSFFGFSTIMTRVDSTIFGALAVTVMGLETNLLGRVFSASASTFLMIAVVHLVFESTFCLAFFPG